MNETILEIKNLHKYFQSGDTVLKVLEGLELKVKSGEIIAITGESGVGKSTLLSLIGGLDSVTEGSIKIRNTEITELSEEELNIFRARYIGFMFQFHHLLQEFNALENVFLPLLIKEKRLKKNFFDKAKLILKEVGLQSRMYHKIGELSGGECQRIALSRAIIKQPELVIADEPTGNIDAKNTEIVFDLIKKLNKKYNTTFIIATHNLEFARIAHSVFTLKNGKLFLR